MDEDGYMQHILFIAILIIMSAFFSATETAYSSLNKTKLKALAEKGDKRAQLTVKLSDNYDKLISTVLIGNNIVNIAMASIATILFIEIYGDIGATISTTVITILVLIFGEISPKSLAKNCPEKFSMFAAPLVNMLIFVLTPVNLIFSIWQTMLTRLFKLEIDNKMSQEELLMLVDEVQNDGSIDKNEGELLRNAIEFTEREAQDILTHRMDIEALRIDSTKENIAKAFSESKFSRLLIYNEDIDHIAGVIHQKDFYTADGISEKEVIELISPVIFVLKTEKISSLLKQLQREKSHMAVVLDEYGGTYGIVTMEDILEELVGEIWDEHDDEIMDPVETHPGNYVVDAYMDLDKFCEEFDIETDSDMVTLGNWVAERLESVPEVGDSFVYDGLTITVTKVDNHRTEEITVKQSLEEIVTCE